MARGLAACALAAACASAGQAYAQGAAPKQAAAGALFRDARRLMSEDKPVSTTGSGGSTSAISASSATSVSSSSNSGTGGMDGAGGASMVCVPAATLACYSGPPGTQDVGFCKAGSMECAPDGLSYGACTGEMLPATESCSTTG